MHLTSRIAIAIAGLAAVLAAAPQSARAEAQLLIEASTGRVLHAENATYPWYPASVTKIMTAYTALRAVKEGKARLDSLLTVSSKAAAQAPTKMGFTVGTTVTLDNAIKMLMVKSANDIAVVIAEGIGGSLEGYADMMNANARRLGMTQTHYVNPNGLPADGQVTSARDLAILARAVIMEFPQYDSYWHIPAIAYGRRVYRNYNTLIDRYPGADGMKSGFICASGYNLVASATRNGRRLIAVILGSYSGRVRAQKAAALLERGFNGGSLAGLTPSLGTVDALAPIDAQPANLRDEMCGGHRRKPASEDNDEDDDAPVNAEAGQDGQALALSGGLKTASGKFVLGPPIESAPPLRVFTGPAGNPDTVERFAAAKGGKKKAAKKKDGAAPKADAAKPDVKPDAKPAAAKPKKKVTAASPAAQ